MSTVPSQTAPGKAAYKSSTPFKEQAKRPQEEEGETVVVTKRRRLDGDDDNDDKEKDCRSGMLALNNRQSTIVLSSPSPSPQIEDMDRIPQVTQQHANEKSSSATGTKKISSVTTSSKRIYVGNLHPRVTKVHLEKLMMRYCHGSNSNHKIAVPAVNVNICYHPTNGQPRGFAFCEFSSIKEAEMAIQSLHGRTLLSRHLIVQEATATASNGGRTTAGRMMTTMTTTTTMDKNRSGSGRNSKQGATTTTTTTTTTTPNSAHMHKNTTRNEMNRKELEEKIAKVKRALKS